MVGGTEVVFFRIIWRSADCIGPVSKNDTKNCDPGKDFYFSLLDIQRIKCIYDGCSFIYTLGCRTKTVLWILRDFVSAVLFNVYTHLSWTLMRNEVNPTLSANPWKTPPTPPAIAPYSLRLFFFRPRLHPISVRKRSGFRVSKYPFYFQDKSNEIFPYWVFLGGFRKGGLVERVRVTHSNCQ